MDGQQISPFPLFLCQHSCDGYAVSVLMGLQRNTDGLLQERIGRVKEYRLSTIVRASDCDHVVALLERRHPDKTPLISIVRVVVNARFAAWFTAQMTTEGAATVH